VRYILLRLSRPVVQCFSARNGQPSPEVHPFRALPAVALWSNKNPLMEADWQLLKLPVPDGASLNESFRPNDENIVMLDFLMGWAVIGSLIDLYLALKVASTAAHARKAL
jgi:hypothetical protein